MDVVDRKNTGFDGRATVSLGTYLLSKNFDVEIRSKYILIKTDFDRDFSLFGNLGVVGRVVGSKNTLLG